jgi:hypothetical protein
MLKVNNHPMGEHSPNLVTLQGGKPRKYLRLDCYNKKYLLCILLLKQKQMAALLLQKNRMPV